ncbi:ATP-binding protein [Desulfovibrio sp. OttesenSCG-928-O18]|nr:ATP-binding protein [Desulfovibrio sp. OttesenSCG-928-O18]
METAWAKIRALLRQRLESGYYKVWIESLVGREESGEFVVHAVSSFAAGFVRDNFLPIIREAAVEILEREVAVRITDAPPPVSLVEPSANPVAASPASESAGLAAAVPPLVASSKASDSISSASLVAAPVSSWQPSASLSVEGQHHLPLRYDEAALRITARSWRHSFEDFVVGPCNELAFAASRSLCKESRGAGILFLSSTPGLGKTHLMQAAGQQLCKECNYRMPRVEYLTAEEFVSRLVMSFKSNDTDRFKARYRDVDVLLLEDVHFLQGKEKMQDELLATLKTLQDRGSKIIFSSSFMPRDLRGMSDQLLSRLHSGFLAVIERPDRAMRKKIFQEKARLSQVTLTEEVSEFLAESIDSDVRQIESCLQNLVLKAKLLKCGITMQMAWEAVQHYAPCEKKLDLAGIIAYVSQGYGISAEQLRSKNRKRVLVTARNTVFFLARKHTDMSLAEIGNAFDRSHSTVIKGITSLEREMSRETSLGRQIAGAIAIIERNGGIISPSL